MQLSKKIVFSLLTLLVFSNPASSQTEGAAAAGGGGIEKWLRLIEDHTRKTLEIVNKLPGYLEDVTIMAKSWNQTEDEKKIIPENQELFGTLNEAYGSSEKSAERINLTNTMTLKYLKAGSSNATNPSTPPNANMLAYPILLGKPLFPDEKYKANSKQYMQAYLDNVANVNYPLPQLDPTWSDKNPYKKLYANYYNSMASIQSFNNFVLSGLSRQTEIEEKSKALSDKASDSAWFEQVATEDLGLVLRHILMYVSQSYVQQNRITQLQQQQLTAQVMTNTLLMMQVQQDVGVQLIRSGDNFK